MHSGSVTPHRTLWLWGVLLSLSTLPFLFVYHVAGDAITHYFNISTFGQAFWEGDLYPRWLTHGNDHLGSPAMFYYFPFTYFISSIFYPLTWMGWNIEQLFLLQLFLNNIITLIGCICWLKPITGSRIALLLAGFYLWFPYRSELIFFRPTLAELWLLALLPWVMWSLDKLKKNPTRWPMLALLLALCILAHIPATLVLLVAIGVLIATKTLPGRIAAPLLLALLSALALTAIYWWPAILYKPFVVGNAGLELFHTYPNRQPIAADLNTSRLRLLVNGAASCVFCLVFCISLLRSPQMKNHGELKRLTLAALVLTCIALITMLPFSAPLWAALQQLPVLPDIVMPWRFQALWLISAMLAGIAAFQLTLLRNGWEMDVKILAGLVLILAVFAMGALVKKPAEDYYTILKYDLAPLREYHTIWQKENLTQPELIADINSGPKFAKVMKGKAAVTNAQITPHEITFDVNASRPSVLELRHLYFPSWEIQPDNVALNIAPVNGRMLLEIPEGTHYIVLKQQVYSKRLHPFLPYLPPFTLVIWLVLAFMIIRKRLRPL